MFGEFVVNRGTVGIAQRNRRRICAKTFPQDLNETEPVFDRELQNLDDVSITHRR